MFWRNFRHALFFVLVTAFLSSICTRAADNSDSLWQLSLVAVLLMTGIILFAVILAKCCDFKGED
jgi:hypothetical protein